MGIFQSLESIRELVATKEKGFNKSGSFRKKAFDESELDFLEGQVSEMGDILDSLNTPDEFNELLEKYGKNDPEAVKQIREEMNVGTLGDKVGVEGSIQALSTWIKDITFFPDWVKWLQENDFGSTDPDTMLIADEDILELQGTLLVRFIPEKTQFKADVYITEFTSTKIGPKTYGVDFLPFKEQRAGRRYLNRYAYWDPTKSGSVPGGRTKTFKAKPRGGNATDNKQIIKGQLHGRSASSRQIQRKTKQLSTSMRGMKGF